MFYIVTFPKVVLQDIKKKKKLTLTKHSVSAGQLHV